MAAGAVLVALILVVTVLTGNHFHDGHVGVKFILSFEASSRVYEEYSSGSAVLSRSRRVVSRKYEIAGTGGDLSGEEFQNTEAFIVVRSAVFSVSSVQKIHFARDTYNAG